VLVYPTGVRGERMVIIPEPARSRHANTEPAEPTGID
jgi:hypothetical protein